MTTEVRRWAGHPQETSPPASVGRWRRAPGLVLLGEARDVGVSEPRHLVRRGDGQVLRAELESSSGSADIDTLLVQAITGVQTSAQSPPPGMPQPIRMRISSRL